MNPKLSIVMATKNRARYLPRFFANIEGQMKSCGCASELIVIDGGSTDGAVDVIRSHEHLLSYWVSEPDASVSAAVNKGLKRARGTIVKLVGDDDLFWEGAFRKGVEYLDQHPDVDCVVFHSNWMLELETEERMPFDMPQPSGEITLKWFLEFPYSGTVTPEAAFFRTGSLRDVNGYNEQLHIWAYWDLWLRQAKAEQRIVCVPEKILDRIQTPLSDGRRLNHSPRWAEEFADVLRRHANLYRRLWHKFGGEISPKSVARFYARAATNRLFGMSPRQLLGSRPR